MDHAILRIRNYRCFGNEPQEIRLGSGFTALVGPNNIGKSAALKFVYELRGFWGNLSAEGNFSVLMTGGSYAVDFLSVLDQEEVYNHDSRDLKFSFETEFPDGLKLLLEVTRESGGNHLRCTRVIYKGHEMQGNIGLSSSGSVHFLTGKLPSGEEFKIPTQPYRNFFRMLQRTVYIPAFRNITNIGERSDYYDISTGVAFISQWSHWKTGPTRRENQTIQNITRDIKDLLEFDSLEINASQDGSTLKLVINGKTLALAEVGSGIAQFILTFASVALKQPALLLIDEPELNLHPSLQIKFLTNLASYTDHGVFFATHSMGLARSTADRIYSVQKNKSTVAIKDLEITDNYVEFLGELSFSSYQEIGASKILLAEGPTEVKTFQQLLRKVGKDREVVILSLGGNAMIEADREVELAEVKRLGDPAHMEVLAWIDSEKDSETADVEAHRQAFLETCAKLGIRAQASERRAIENYFTERAAKEALKKPDAVVPGPFERLDGATHWSKKQNWRIAREITLDELAGTDLLSFIESI